MEHTHDPPPPAYTLHDASNPNQSPNPNFDSYANTTTTDNNSNDNSNNNYNSHNIVLPLRPQYIPTDDCPPPLPPRTPSINSATGFGAGQTDPYPEYTNYPHNTPPPPPPHRILSVSSTRDGKQPFPLPNDDHPASRPRLPPRPPTISTASTNDFRSSSSQPHGTPLQRSASSASYNPRSMGDDHLSYPPEKFPAQTIQSPQAVGFQQHLYSEYSTQNSVVGRNPAPINRKRKLLLVYIHGFLGNTTSFNQLPTHLHNLLTYFLSISCPQYTVHTKVYPRFKTRHAISEATEMFSQWLADFESEETDVVLLGHSMGGILAGEVVLLPPMHAPPGTGAERRYRHRIMGLVGFDVPYLGMHPGIITSGISSLFRPSDKRKTPSPAPQQSSSVSSPRVENYDEGPSAEDLFLKQNPHHFNTGLNKPLKGSGPVANSEGTGALGGVWNFVNKHRGNVGGATMQYVLSHMEFAACLADPMGLNTRYKRLKGLEMANGNTGEYRVRFVNYYTVCWGRESPEEMAAREAGHARGPSGTLSPTAVGYSHARQGSKSSLNAGNTLTPDSALRPRTPEGGARGGMDNMNLSPRSERGSFHSARSSLDSHTSEQGGMITISDNPPPTPQPQHPTSVASPQFPPPTNPRPQTPRSPLSPSITVDPSDLNSRSARYSLPPLPPPPQAPPLHADLSHITDPKVQKAHMKENKRLWKEHERQEKVHRKLVKEREKVLVKLEGKDGVVAGGFGAFGGVQGQGQGQMQKPREKEKEKKERKERKFCLVPKEPLSPEEQQMGKVKERTDEFWVKVPMCNTDEVGAHCGLFMAGMEIFDSTGGNDAALSTSSAAPVESGVVGVGGVAEAERMQQVQQSEEELAEQKDIEMRRRQYEKLVGDVGARIEAWVKEHAGTLEAMEVAGDQARWEHREREESGKVAWS